MIVNNTTGTVVQDEAQPRTPQTYAEAEAALAARKAAYCRLFRVDGDPDKPLHEDAKIVLDDLIRFCRGVEPVTAFVPVVVGDKVINGPVDPLMTMQYEGRREALHRVQQHLALTVSDLLRIFNPGLRR